MTTYYTAKTGSDSNAGTIGAPFLTIRKGLTVLQAGDTLSIRTGTYAERINTQAQDVPTGTSWANAVTIAAYPGETVILKPTSGYAVIQIVGNSWTYLIFDGLTIDATSITNRAVDLDGVGTSGAGRIRFINCEVKNSPGSGILTHRKSYFNEILNCTIHDNGANPAGTGISGHGIYCSTSNNRIEGCTLHSNYGYGIQVYDGHTPKDAHRNIVRGNRIYNNGRTTARRDGGLVIGSGDGNLAANNLIYNHARGNGLVVGFNASTNSKIYNNTIYNNADAGIVVLSSSTSAIIRNNIVYSNGTNINNNSGGTTLSHNLTTNPSFVNAGAGDFHLQAGSAARDAGTTLSDVPADFDKGLRPVGTTYDIGAYEYGSTVGTEPPPTVPTAPSNLAVAVLSSSRLSLSWTDNSSTESGFVISRSLNNITWADVITVGANVTSYIDGGLTANTLYYYRVRAINSVGASANTSVASNTTAAAPSAPSAPSGLGATAFSSSRIDLSWTDTSSNEDNFAIERSLNGVDFTQIATVNPNVTTYASTGLSSSTLYYYRVRASNSAGNSAYSNTASATTLTPPGAVPTAPSDLQVTVISFDQLDVSWTQYAGDADIFKIERSLDGVSFTQIGTTDDGVLYFSDITCDPLTTYFYRVRATNNTGNSAYSNITNATTVALDVEIFDTNQLRSLLGLSPVPDGLISTGADQRHLLGLYRGPYDDAVRALVGPLNVQQRFITLAQLALDYGTFFYANYYDDGAATYVPRLVGHGSITEELPDLFNTVLGRRNAQVQFSTIETGDVEAPTLAYHAMTEDLYSQHALIRIYDLEAGADVMALNAPITSYDIASGTLEIEDDADAIFETLIPKVRLRDIYPEVDLSTGRGQDPPVIIPFGVMRKVPLYLVEIADDGYSNPQYRYGAVRKPLTGTLVWATIYRDGQVVDETDYIEIENPDGYLCVAFFVDQRDTGGRPLTILADLVSSEFGHSPARALEFILSDSTYGLGQAVNAASIAQSVLDYTGTGQRIGGGFWQQSVAKAVIPLLLLHGAYISRNAGDQWLLTVDTIDKHSQPTDDVLQLGMGDTAAWQNILSIQPRHRRVNERLSLLTVKGVWDPDFSGSGTWLVTADRTRSVAGVNKSIENPFLSDPSTVDREADYLFTRYAAQDRSLSVQTAAETYLLELGSLVKVNIPNYSLNERLLEVRTKGFVGGDTAAFTLTLYGWDEHAFVYTLGRPIILPRATVLSDFRRTPPDEPTNFALSSYDVSTGEEGHVQCFATLIADAPTHNVTHLVFMAFRAGSGIPHSFIQVATEPRAVVVTGQLEVTPGLLYDYACYALNVDNDADRQESTRAQITNQLAVGDTVSPLPPTGLVATAGVGRTVSLNWNDNTDLDLKTYVVYRSTDAAFSSDYATDEASTEVGEVRASRMVDQHEIAYDTFYYYRVKAKDLSGNLSGFSNTSVAYVHRITATDHGARTIHTPHRQPFNALVSSVSVPAHTSFSYDTGLPADSYMYTAGVLGIQATDEWDSASSVNGTRLFDFVASGPLPGGFDTNYHGGFWNGVAATWNTTVKARGW